MPKPSTCPKLLQELQKHLAYNPKTGEITYKNTRYGVKEVGEVAGNVASDGYLKFNFRFNSKDRCIITHRLAWALHYGSWPENQLDHINRVKTDNRIVNLREVTQAENNYNRPKYKTKNYYKGVYKRNDKFLAVVTKDRVQHRLGLFTCPTLAALTYDKKAKELFGECELNFPELL